MSKKLFRLFTLAVLVALLALSQFSANVAHAAPVTVRIYVGLGTGTQDAQRKGQEELAKQWNSTHPDVQIKFDYNDHATARDVLLTQIAGGNAPDIVGPVGIGGINETGELWADLSSNFTKDSAILNLKDFEESTLNLYHLGGKQIAIPLGVYPSFMYVNKDLFEQAQMELPPTDYKDGKPMYQGKLWNMDALQVLAIKLTQDKNGHYADEKEFDPKNITIYGFADTDSDLRGFAMQFSPGHAGVAPDGKTAMFNDPTFLTAMQWRHDAIFKSHFFPDTAARKDLTKGGTSNTFASGRVAMFYSHTWSLADMKGMKAKWVAGVAPVAPNGKLTARINADTFSILAKSQHKDAAWEVLKWLTSTESSAKTCAIYGCLPARSSARAAWETQIRSDYPLLDLGVVYGGIKYLDNPNSEAPMLHYNQAYDKLAQFFARVDSEPDLDVKRELDKLNSQMQAIFDANAVTP